MAVEIPIGAGGGERGHEVLRLRRPSRFAARLAALRMTENQAATRLKIAATKMGLAAWLMMWSALASGTTYYVSASSGNDGNSGTSAASAWQTVAKANGQTYQAGDAILFKRGDVWNESLVAPSSGVAGNPITFDAYGTGPAPNLTGYYAVPAAAWVLVSGNAWKAALPAGYTAVNFCLFGSVWGQKVAASSSNLTAQWNFYLANGYLYIFSTGNPGNFYNVPIVPMALSNVPVINVNGKSWLTFQHFLVNWFDQYGVYVQGGSDHLVFANMEADSMIPQGTQPLGFYVNENAPGPSDIKIYNSEAHLNYDGFRFDGAATAITLVNDKAYANRDGALVDNTSAVNYSYCHFYASSLALATSTDVLWTSGTGPIAGPGNIAQDTAPWVQAYQRYPAQVTLTVDDAGMTAGADTYYANTVLPIADAAGVPVGAAITVGYPLAQTLISEFQGWINLGRDVTSHSMSHTYYTNTDALDIQYTGTGTAATLSISNKTLTIAVTGASDSVSYSLAQGQAQGTIKGLRLALVATGKFTATESTPCQGPYGTGC
jgi:Right handed beta helix region